MDKDVLQLELQQINGHLSQLTDDVMRMREEVRAIASEVQARGADMPPLLKGINMWSFLTFATVLVYVLHAW